MTQFYSDESRENDPHALPDCEVFEIDNKGRSVDTGEPFVLPIRAMSPTDWQRPAGITGFAPQAAFPIPMRLVRLPRRHSQLLTQGIFDMGTTKNHARIIKVHNRLWKVPGDTGYALQSRKTLHGAIRLARQMYPGKPIHVMEQGPMAHGVATLTLIDVIPAE